MIGRCKILVSKPSPLVDSAFPSLRDFVLAHPRLLVLTGAGVSTDSGIPAYRDASGAWMRQTPIQYQTFVRHAEARQRYWARSFMGWEAVAAARPNAAHAALARLEQAGLLHGLITQNVDGLHQKAGSRNVIDLHGRLDRVECLSCGRVTARRWLQDELLSLNPQWTARTGALAPDGDVDLLDAAYSSFRVADCSGCGGLLKPEVVFFGEQVPKPRVAQCFEWLETADALLVVGSSLTVWSGYRFVRAARAQNKPVAAVNLGKTRGDGEFDLKVERPCGETLNELLAELEPLA